MTDQSSAYDIAIASQNHRITYPTRSIVTTAIEDPRLYVRRTGEIVIIEEMAKEHLLAAISMIERGYDYKGNPIPGHSRRKLSDLIEAATRKGWLQSEDGWDS